MLWPGCRISVLGRISDDMELYLHVGMFTRRYQSAFRFHRRKRLMELHLQFGWGMMEHCRHLLSSWGGGTAILSPRDLTDDQLTRLSSDMLDIDNVSVLLDPQFYLPYSDHERLCSHDFWPSDYDSGTFWQGQDLTNLLKRLLDLNTKLSTAHFILPGLLAPTINDDWVETQRSVLEEAQALNQELPLLMTIALSGDAVRDDDQVATLIETSEKWQPDGYYLVFEHPKGQYLVDDATWLANLLDIVAGFRLRGRHVILGYCNHQMLISAITKVQAISSGTWMNVRSFPPDKFRTAYEEEIKQRATWYYCPQPLSEYKLPFLDIAQRFGFLAGLAPDVTIDGRYVTALFAGSQPSTVGLTEQAAFRHYLHALRGQVIAGVRPTFDETVKHHEQILDTAERLLTNLRTSGVRGQLRDFYEIIDVNRAALAAFQQQRGAIMNRKWSAL